MIKYLFQYNVLYNMYDVLIKIKMYEVYSL